jgi:hypothetical protein
MGMAMMNPIVDSMVSPTGLKTAFANLAKQQQAAKAKGGGDGDVDGKGSGAKGSIPLDPEIRRQGFNRFIVTGKDTPGSGLVFERSGLGWKLSGIDLPPMPPRS